MEPQHLHVHVHVHPDTELIRAVARIEQALGSVLTMEAMQMTDLTRITNEVTEISDASDAAVAALGSLAQQVRDLSTDPAALNALADELDAKGNELAAAILAGTAADPNAGGGEVPVDGGGEPPVV